MRKARIGNRAAKSSTKLIPRGFPEEVTSETHRPAITGLERDHAPVNNLRHQANGGKRKGWHLTPKHRIMRDTRSSGESACCQSEFF
jgi:hypothetical protein